MYVRIARALASGLGLCAALAVAAGCGGTQSSSTVSGPATVATVNVGIGTKVNSLDPNLFVNTTETSVLHLIGGTLFELRASGAVVPGLATSIEPSSDGLTQTAHLRAGLKFSDGTPLTAADVVATLERGIHNRANAYAGFYAPIASVTAPDATTVVFKLKRPFPSLRTVLGEPEFMVLPARSVDPAAGTAQKSVASDPISAGPYELVSWGGGPTVVLRRNPDYFGAKGRAATVRFVAIPDFNASASQLRTGQIDMSVLLPPSLAPSLAQTSGIHTVSASLYGFQNLFMSHKGLTADVNVRRAISLALDRGELVRTALYGKVKPLAGFWPSTTTGYDPGISTARDVAGAKRLLAGTPCAHGCSIELMYETDDQAWAEQAAVIVQSNLKDVGIDVKLVHLDQPTVITRLTGRKYDLCLYGNYDLANVPDGLIAYNLLPDGGLDAAFSGYDSPQMQQYAKQAVETTGAQQKAALRDIETQFAKDMPFVTFSDFVNLYATRLPDKVISMGRGGYVDVGRVGE